MYFAIPFQFFIKGAAARKTAGKPNGDSRGDAVKDSGSNGLIGARSAF